MTKRLVDIDDRTLRAAQRQLRTRTIKETVNVALRAAAGANRSRIERALSYLGRAALADRASAWR